MKIIAFCLAILLLLSALASCGRRQDILNQIESEKAAESAAEESSIVTMGGGRETVAPEPGTEHPNPDNPSESYAPPVITIPDPNSKYPNNAGYQLTAGINKGGDGCYINITPEELQKGFNSYFDYTNNNYVNSPMGVIFTPLNGDRTFYNKVTGNVTHICPDPLCRHDSCVWSEMQNFKFVSDTHIYFSAGSATSHTLYRSDLNRNHVESLELDMTNSANKIFYVDGDLLYMQRLIYKENDAGDFYFGVFDCKTKEFTVIYDQNTWILAVTGGDTVWYWRSDVDDTAIYKADLNFTHQEKVLTTDTKINILMANDEYLLIGEGRKYPASYLYCIHTGKKIHLPENLHTSSDPTLDSKYLYYSKDITEAEKAISPLKDFYNYEVPRGNKVPYRPGLFNGDGRVYRLNLETDKEELCAEISYNGVPIRIVELVADGDAVFISYLTYEDYNNFYNQDHGMQPDGTIDYYKMASYRYMYVDMTNGTVNLLNPYQIG